VTIGPLPTHSVPTRAELLALARKYQVMSQLRAAGAGDETPEERAALKALAAEFPGALRELDTLATDEIATRAQALESAARDDRPEPWMAWMHAYHRLMRDALRVRRGHASEVDERFAAAVHKPPSGRIMLAVFHRLGELYGESPKKLWDALFPPRKGDRGYRSQ
jgi:hypothetical protein